MKVRIWACCTCVPGDLDPLLPELYGTREEAEAHMESEMRGEWESGFAPCDDEGEPLAYPGDWREAHAMLADDNPEWGRYELSYHDVEVPDMETFIRTAIDKAEKEKTDA